MASTAPPDAPDPGSTTTLAVLPRGGQARIVRVEGGGPFRRRLLELGFLPGTVVARAGQAPLGDPLSFRVRHAIVSLRRRDAARIIVEPSA